MSIKFRCHGFAGSIVEVCETKEVMPFSPYNPLAKLKHADVVIIQDDCPDSQSGIYFDPKSYKSFIQSEAERLGIIGDTNDY